MRLVVLTLALALFVATPAHAEPAGLEVTGWILPSGTNRMVERNADGLSTLSVVGVSVTHGGDRVTATTADTARLRRAARRHGLGAELLFNNYSNAREAFDPVAAHRLLSDRGHVRAVTQRLARYVVRQGWDGVNVDLELVKARDRRGLVAFVEALQAAMPPARTVTIDVSAATSLQSYRRRGYLMADLGRAADVIKLMTYDYSGPTWSGPGPIGPLEWQEDAALAALAVVPAERLDLGVAGYGYSWPRTGTGRSHTLPGIRALLRRHDVQPVWRAAAGEWTAVLPNGTRLWWSDRRSYRQRVALARKHDLHGLAVWRLGSADTLR